MKLERNSLRIKDLEKRIEQFKTIMILFEQKKSVQEIANMYGVAKSTIYDIIKANSTDFSVEA